MMENYHLHQLINLVCVNPVKIFGIKIKGFIEVGYDADFTIVDMNKKIIIENDKIESKCGWSPFNGDISREHRSNYNCRNENERWRNYWRT